MGAASGWKSRKKSQDEGEWSRRKALGLASQVSFPGQASLASLKAGKMGVCPQGGLSEQKVG